MNNFFRAKYGKFVITFTVLIILAVLGFLIFTLIYPFQDLKTRLVILGIAVFISLCLIYLFFLSPKGYRLEESSLELVRRAGKEGIPYRDIEKVYKIPGRALFLTLRITGSRGFFGFVGSVKTRGEKETYFFAASSELVAVETPSKIYVISPENREKFIKELKRKLKGSDEQNLAKEKP